MLIIFFFHYLKGFYNTMFSYAVSNEKSDIFLQIITFLFSLPAFKIFSLSGFEKFHYSVSLCSFLNFFFIFY